MSPSVLPSGWRDLSRISRRAAANDSRHNMHLYETKMAERRGGARTSASVQKGRSGSIWRLGSSAQNSKSDPWKWSVVHRRLLKLQRKLAKLLDVRGAAVIEYGLMMALIAIVIIVAVTSVGSR